MCHLGAEAPSCCCRPRESSAPQGNGGQRSIGFLPQKLQGKGCRGASSQPDPCVRQLVKWLPVISTFQYSYPFPVCVCVCVYMCICVLVCPCIVCKHVWGRGFEWVFTCKHMCVYVCVQACIVGIFIMYLFIYLAMLGLNCGTWDLLLWHTDSLVMAHRLSPLSSGLVAPTTCGS